MTESKLVRDLNEPRKEILEMKTINPLAHAEATDSTWKPLFKIGGIAALIMLPIIPLESFIFIAFPPPSTVIDFFTLFQKNWFVGLLDRDLLLIVDNVLLILIYLALYAALVRANQSLMTIGLTLSLIGIASYFPSNTAFEMLSLSHQYAASTTEAQKTILLASGQSMLAIYQGTAFDVYYVLNAIALLIFSIVMLRSNIFSKANAYLGIAAGILMIIPSTAGTIGIYFSLFSLVPWFVWLILFARRLFQLARA